MDEYVGLPKEHSKVIIPLCWNNFSAILTSIENTNLLNGNAADLEAECAAYES